MSCALTQGYVQDCRDSIGGAKTVHFIEQSNIASTTVTAGVVTALTKVTAKQFWPYKPARDTLSAKSTITTNLQTGSTYFAQEVQLALNKLQTNTRLEVQKLAQNTLVAVVTDANGKHWMYGYKNGLDVTGGDTGTGAASGDRNGYMLTLTGQEPEDAIEVDNTTFLTLETPGA